MHHPLLAREHAHTRTHTHTLAFVQSKPGTAATRAGTLDSMSNRTAAGVSALAGSSASEPSESSSPEEAARAMEARVHTLVEAAAAAASRGDVVMCLERAKEAGRKERALVKHREANSLADSINIDLTYAVCFNLAHAVSTGA